MKLLFVCGCLEPGKDGVGDYTRLLASKIIKAGHSVHIIALYDQFIPLEVEEIQIIQDVKVKVWRLSRSSNSKDRLAKAKEKFKKFNPDWVSLQFVAYSFHSKGLNFRLPSLMEQLSGEFYWHLMIHEPWLYGRKIKFRHNIVGFMQKKLLKLLIKKLQPKIIHTSNAYYQKILNFGRIKASLLNLPGNIPVHKTHNSQIIKEFADLGITEKSRNEFLILGTFGMMRSQMSYIALLKSQIKIREPKKKKIVFFSIGKTGDVSTQIFKELKEKFNDEILLHKFGEKTPGEISTFFQFLDYGVAGVPHHLLGKSGVYAAMREHKLKILIPETDLDAIHISEKEKFEFSDYLIHLPDEKFSARHVANQFIEALTLSFKSS